MLFGKGASLGGLDRPWIRPSHCLFDPRVCGLVVSAGPLGDGTGLARAGRLLHGCGAGGRGFFVLDDRFDGDRGRAFGGPVDGRRSAACADRVGTADVG